MRSSRYVILRRVEAPQRTRGSAQQTAASTSATPIAVEVEEIDARRARDLRRARDVEAVAPIIRMRLVAPVGLADAATGPDSDPVWGIAAVGADTSPFSGDGVTVAVLDTGIDATHEAFTGVELTTRNFTGEVDDDIHGHGTHCAGTIFGREVGGTRIGVAPGVRRALIGKILDEDGGDSDTIVEAIQWALQGGAQVISMSLGIDFPGLVADLVNEGMPTDLATSMALEGYRANILLFERLGSLVQAQAGFTSACLLVAAAGNESKRDLDPTYVIAVGPPAAADGLVSVAAVGQGPAGYTVASFSNSGARVAGPGVGILSARAGGGSTKMSGTSMATPHVAGVAALWAEKLMKSNQFAQKRFTDRVVGSATTDCLDSDFDPVDVGNGVVRAPQR